MQANAAIKVGMAALLGVGLFVWAWVYFSHLDLNHYQMIVRFQDTRGLLRQSPVRMNGVTIGEVKSIDLDQTDLKPVITLSIQKERRIPANARIRITSGLLITNPQIEVYLLEAASAQSLAPGVWPPELVDERPANALAQVSPEADKAVKSLAATLNQLSPKMVGLVDRLQSVLKRTDAMLANFEATSASVRSLVAEPKIRTTLVQTLDDLAAVTKEGRRLAQEMSVQLREIVKKSGGRLDELLAGLLDTLQKGTDTVDAARAAVTKLTEQFSDPRVQQSLQETLDLLKTTIARFSQIADDIHQLSGDANVQRDLKATVTTVREVAEQGQQLVERFNTLASRIHIPSGGPRFGIGQPTFRVDMLLRGDKPHFRSDIGMRLPIGTQNAIHLGLYDFAEGNRLTAQYETLLGGGTAVRYGLYASKLGLGMDWRVTPSTLLSFDGYNPNRLVLDARALVDVSQDFSIWFGADSIFRHTTPVLGVRLKR